MDLGVKLNNFLPVDIRSDLLWELISVIKNFDPAIIEQGQIRC